MDTKVPAALEPFLPGLLDDSLSKEQQEQLANVLAADPACRAFYLRYMRVNAMLKFMHGGLSPSEWGPELANEISLVQEVLEEEEQARRKREQEEEVARFNAEEARRQEKVKQRELQPTDRGNGILPFPIHIIGAAAAMVLVAIILINQLAAPDAPPNPKVVVTNASFTALENAEWSAGEFAVGDSLPARQKIALTAGVAEITTELGAVVKIQAPATIELPSGTHAIRLHAGLLVGIVENDDAAGFQVLSPGWTVTDLGTRFGIFVSDSGVTDVHVLQGKVEAIADTAPEDAEPFLLVAGESASAKTGEDTVTTIEHEPQQFAQLVPRLPAVTTASINVDGFNVCVVPRGVREDALLFSDRAYEINGVDKRGIPSELLGGDLVQMPVNARPDVTPDVGNKLQLELQLGGLSDVYVLKSEITDAQGWLKRDYVNTGQHVGVDFAKKNAAGVVTGNGVGPGVSIDRKFEVWKRKQPESGKLIVAGATRGSMYAVIVVPQQADP